VSSLRKRLSLSLAASLALFFIAQTLMIGNTVEDLSERNLLSRLNHDQEQILASLEWNPPAPPRLQRSLIPAIYQRPFSGHYFQIDIAGQQLRSRSLWDENLPPLSRTIERNIPGPRDQQLLAVQHSVIMHGQQISIRTAENIAPMEKATEEFERNMLLFAAGAVLTLMILQGWLIKHTLKPLQRIRSEISRLQSGQLKQIEGSAPDEIMPLVNEINHLIHLTQQRLKRSRHALGDLAHSLKTPLAVARQITEQQAPSKSSSQLSEQISCIEHRIDRELVRARTAGRMPGGQWHHPEQDIRDIVAMLGKVFPQVSCSLQLSEGMSIPCDREDMLEIIGNLLENACKWAHSRVRCSVSQQDNGTGICIEDDGPGIEESQCRVLLERGIRADESRPGHGLGLSIVAEMVAAYEGSISLSRSTALSGLKINISLPS